MMTFTTRAAGNSVAYNWLAVARHYLGGHRAIIVLAIVAVVVGAALNWSWLAAVGVAPVLLSALPCLVMCGLGLCMNRLVGRSCASASSQPPQESVPPPTTLPVMNQTAPDIAPPGLAGCGRELAVAEADPAAAQSSNLGEGD
jgi:hypothetical protein